MQKLILLSFIFLLSYCNPSQNLGQQLLDKTMAYHDPNHKWPELKTHLYLTSTDTAGNENPFEIEIDNATGYFCHISHEDGKEIVKGLSNGKEFYLINGEKNISGEDRKKYELTPESVKWVHNFYGYLYGLPMKLTDKGTIVSDTMFREQINGKNYQVMHVEYDSTVGNELWNFYLDPDTSALEGYRFFYKGEPNEGEHIMLQEVLNVEGIKIPKVRKWYLNKDNKYLGTDNLIKAEKLTSYRI
jgi:hypothetical protein